MRPGPQPEDQLLCRRQTHVTAATTMSFDLSEERSILDLNIRKEFAQIIERWRNNAITEDDSKYLERLAVTDEEFVLVTDDFGLRHGVELMNHHIHLIEYPTALHEVMTRRMDIWVFQAYSLQLIAMGSTSKIVHYFAYCHSSCVRKRLR